MTFHWSITMHNHIVFGFIGLYFFIPTHPFPYANSSMNPCLLLCCMHVTFSAHSKNLIECSIYVLSIEHEESPHKGAQAGDKNLTTANFLHAGGGCYSQLLLINSGVTS